MHRQLVLIDCSLQVGLEGETPKNRRIHAWLEELDAPLALALCRVHRYVGVAQEFVGILTRCAAKRHADAGGDQHILALNRDRRSELFEDSVSKAQRVLDTRGILDEDGELVPSETCGRIARAKGTLDSARDLDQRRVSPAA